MRRLIAWLIDGLPFDPRSRRALDETFLGWAHEEKSASGVATGLVQISGVASIIRAMVRLAGREMTRVPLPWLFRRAALHVILPAVIGSVAVVWVLLASGFSTMVHPVALAATSL